MGKDGGEEAVRARHRANMEMLARYPGVVSVAFGLKESGGEVRPVWAYRVYVKRKRPNEELAPAERIPERVDGFRTDVVVAAVTVPATKSASVRPGSQIQRGVLNDPPASGTLGLIVLKDGVRHLLTNAHVLEDDRHFEYPHMYSPTRKRSAGTDCRNPAAEILRNNGIQVPRTARLTTSGAPPHRFAGRDYVVDAGIARLMPDVESSNVFGSAPVSATLAALLPEVPSEGDAPASIVRLEKRGARTGHTVGEVVHYFSPFTLRDGSSTDLFDIEVKPVSGTHRYERDYVLPSDADVAAAVERWRDQAVRATPRVEGGRTVLHLEGDVFVQQGDSGSVVVIHRDDPSAPRQAVGLLHSASAASIPRTDPLAFEHVPDDEPLYTGNGHVCFMPAVFDALGLDPSAAITPGVPGAGAVLELPPAWDEIDQPAFAALEGAARETELGKELFALVNRHYPELAHLVHHRRRVTVAWHRLGGPAFVASFLRTNGDPDAPLPRTVNGLGLPQALVRFRDVLMRECSDELRTVLADNTDRIVALAERAHTLRDLQRALDDVGTTH